MTWSFLSHQLPFCSNLDLAGVSDWSNGGTGGRDDPCCLSHTSVQARMRMSFKLRGRDKETPRSQLGMGQIHRRQVGQRVESGTP